MRCALGGAALAPPAANGADDDGTDDRRDDRWDVDPRQHRVEIERTVLDVRPQRTADYRADDSEDDRHDQPVPRAENHVGDVAGNSTDNEPRDDAHSFTSTPIFPPRE